MSAARQLDRAGRPVRDVWTPRRPPPNKGQRFPPNPPPASAIVRAAARLGNEPPDLRLAALLALLWRAGLGLSEALTAHENDLDEEQGVVIVRSKREAARRQASMDEWGFERVRRWVRVRRTLPDGPLLCVLRGPTAGQNWGHTHARAAVVRLGKDAGVGNFRPQQLRYAHATELLAQGVAPAEAYRQLGISTVRNNRAPALTSFGAGRQASDVLKPPDAERVLRRNPTMPTDHAQRRGVCAAPSRCAGCRRVRTDGRLAGLAPRLERRAGAAVPSRGQDPARCRRGPAISPANTSAL